MRHGWNASAYQILNPGLRLWFAERGDAVAGYASFHDTWVIAGAPVCAEWRLDAVSRELERSASMLGARVVYFAAGGRLARSLERDRHHVLRVGAQPTWNATSWSTIVRQKASLRAQLNRARNKGVVVTEWPARIAERSGTLEQVRARWLSARGLPPLHFMTESDTLGDLRDRRVFVAERGSQGVVAFLVATPVPARDGWLIEQWPRLRSAPNGTMQLLVDAAMRAHGRRFYNFRGLEAFKASFEPADWEPLYVATREPKLTLTDLRAIAGVFGGGAPERLVARAIATAALRELHIA